MSSVPANGDLRANPTLTSIRITFSEPMDVATFFWQVPINQPDFPFVTADPFWVDSNRTLVLPVQLAANTTYRIPINVGGQIIFRSAQFGVAVNPGYISFATAQGAETSVSPAIVPPGYNIPNLPYIGQTPRIPNQPGVISPARATAISGVGVSTRANPMISSRGSGGVNGPSASPTPTASRPQGRSRVVRRAATPVVTPNS